MALMHDEGEPYGHLKIGPSTPSIEDIAKLVSMSVEDVGGGISELESRGVLSRTKAGVIYSRRMVRDEKKRLQGKKFGRLGGNPGLTGVVKGAVNSGLNTPPDSDSNSDSVVSASSSKEEGKKVGNFEAWWKMYPKKVGKRKCASVWKSLEKSRELPPLSDMLEKLQRQVRLDRQWREGFIPNPETYLNQGRWDDDIDTRPARRSDRQLKEEIAGTESSIRPASSSGHWADGQTYISNDTRKPHD